MVIKSISDFYSYSLFIFDLDNTIYNEEDYLFQAYMAIAGKIASKIPSFKKEQLFDIIKDIYQKEGREKLFDKFLMAVHLDNSFLSICLGILRSFEPEKQIEIDKNAKYVLSTLKSRNKKIVVLTNGNVDQQKNKISHINWEGLDSYINFVFADKIEPKPSPAGVLHILEVSCIEKAKTVFIGDSETDRACALNSGVNYLDVNLLSVLLSGL